MQGEEESRYCGIAFLGTLVGTLMLFLSHGMKAPGVCQKGKTGQSKQVGKVPQNAHLCLLQEHRISPIFCILEKVWSGR